MLRGVIIAALLGFLVQAVLKSYLLPHGAAVEVPVEDRHKYGTLDPTNDSLRAKHGKFSRIYERVEEGSEPLMKGPETVVIGGKGKVYVLTEEGLLVSLTDFKPIPDTVIPSVSAKASLVTDLGMGRPLGGKFTMDGNTIYVADALLGLIRVENPEGYPTSKVELVANKVLDNGVMTRILYANDVAIGPKTGMVYFTDSTTIDPGRLGTRSWDTMYAAKMDYVRGSKTGRLLQYDPSNNEVKVLARNISFANGVAVDQDESFVFFAETFRLKLLKYNLKGPKKGELEVVVDGDDMVGYADGIECNWDGKKKCYAAIASLVIPVSKLFLKLPTPLDIYFRTFLMLLPKWLTPPVVPYGGIAEVDARTGKELRMIQDPDAQDSGMVNGVTAWENKLYVGSLRNDFIGVYDLN